MGGSAPIANLPPSTSRLAMVDGWHFFLISIIEGIRYFGLYCTATGVPLLGITGTSTTEYCIMLDDGGDLRPIYIL